MKKILVVDDNEMNLDILRRFLKRKHYQVLAARNGNLALEMVEKQPPDLIIMDLSMPGMDGWEATKRLKADGRVNDIPIIVLSAHPLEADKKSAFEAGCDAYDVKPIDSWRLLRKIRRLIV